MAENNEMIQALKMSVKDELDDTIKYVKMAHKAKEYGKSQDVQIFRDMAKEEYTHAGHVNRLLKENGSNTNEYHTLWMEAEKAVHELY